MVQFVFLQRILATSGVLFHPTWVSVRLLIGWPMLTLAVYVFNGLTDRDADRVNHSDRPIASGRLLRQHALNASMMLSILGVALCWWAGEVPACLAVAFLGLGWAYSAGPAWKNTAVGAAAVIGSGAALTYTAGWAVRGTVTVDEIYFAVALSVWIGVCSATKDISDVDGDRLAGRRTIPVIMGGTRAACLIGALTITVAGLFAAAAVLTSPRLTGAAVMVLTGSVIVAISLPAAAAASTRSAGRRPYRAFLSTQIASNAAALMFTSV